MGKQEINIITMQFDEETNFRTISILIFVELERIIDQCKTKFEYRKKGKSQGNSEKN